MVHHGAHELCNGWPFALWNLDARNVQVTLNLLAAAQRKYDLVRFAATLLTGTQKGLGHPFGVCGADKGHKRNQQPVMSFCLEGVVRHGIGLNDHVMLVEHQQRQGHAGEQRLKAFRSTFRYGLAVIQYFVLDFQLILVIAQLCNERCQRIIARQIIREIE